MKMRPMLRSLIARLLILLICLVAFLPGSSPAETPAAKRTGAELRFVVILSRHGVRSSTGNPTQYAKYSRAAWPKWNVQPGYLTPHGYELMKLFGAYDREWMAGKGLLTASACGDATQVTIMADSDERTRETGKALAEGMFPHCRVPFESLPQGTQDPLFHPMSEGETHPNPALEAAAIRGRIGGDPANLTQAYRPNLAALDHVLDGCGHTPADASKPVSLISIPATLTPGTKRAELHGPLDEASSLTENLLLEYTDGMPAADVGWGCVDGATLRSLMALHVAEEDIKDRTPVIARTGASNLLNRILLAIAQQVSGKPLAGAPGKPGDRLLLLVGHDTNIANVAGVLHLDWILDGRRDDTPPGGPCFSSCGTTYPPAQIPSRSNTRHRRSSKCATHRF